mmetsp:Transcript_6103/g.17483  ORF Transcript_6103/g.17483 Transcript_6103/m.17483 type:complete len:256 (-) Transcript_6103:266-1033(-)
MQSMADEVPTAHPDVISLFNQAINDLEAAGAVIVEDFNITGNTLGEDWTGYVQDIGPTVGHWNVNGIWVSLWSQPNGFEREKQIDAYLAASGSRFKSAREIYASGLFHPFARSGMESQLAEQNLTDLESFCGEGAETFLENPCRMEFRRNLADSMDAANVSVIVYPSWRNEPYLIGNHMPYANTNCAHIRPQTGAPSITVPMGFIQLTAGPPTRLPMNIEMIARSFDEPSLFKVAHGYEAVTKHRFAPPLFIECA